MTALTANKAGRVEMTSPRLAKQTWSDMPVVDRWELLTLYEEVAFNHRLPEEITLDVVIRISLVANGLGGKDPSQIQEWIESQWQRNPYIDLEESEPPQIGRLLETGSIDLSFAQQRRLAFILAIPISVMDYVTSPAPS